MVKKILLLGVLGIAAIAQSPSSSTIPDIQTAITNMQKVLADAQLDATQLAQVSNINTVCSTCLTSLASILAGASPGQYNSIVLCCGPNTVPATPPGSSVLYIFQTPLGITVPTVNTNGTTK